MTSNGSLALVVYRASIAGVVSSKLDFRVRWFANVDPDEVRALIENEPLERYPNDEQDEVCWKLVEIIAIEQFAPTDSGDEVIGFITSTDALPEWDDSKDEPKETEA